MLNKTLDRPSTKLALKNILLDKELCKILILIRISEIYASVLYDEEKFKFFLGDNYKFKRLLGYRDDKNIDKLLNIMAELMKKGKNYIRNKINTSDIPYLIFHE